MSIRIEGSVSIGWMHHEYGFTADEAYYFDPEVRRQKICEMQDLVAHRFPNYELNFFESNLIDGNHWHRDMLGIGQIQPNLITGVVAGSQFVIPGDKDPDIKMTPLRELDATGLKQLRKIQWEEVYPINMFLEQIDQLKVKYGNQHPIIPPFFWDPSGRATIHGPITTAQKFMGERFFLEMIDNETFAHEFLDWIVDSYIDLCKLFTKRVGMEINSVHIGECSGCMLGGDQWEKFALPATQKLIDELGPGRMHSCGQSTHLLEAFSKLDNMCCLNTGTGTSVAHARRIYGGDMPIEVAPDAKTFCFGTSDDMKTFVDESLDENADGDFMFIYHFDQGYPEKNVCALNDRLIDLGLAKPGRRHPASGTPTMD